MCLLNNVVYGKPSDNVDAFRMLKTFSNNTHQVCTGVCILQGDLTIKTFSETTISPLALLYNMPGRPQNFRKVKMCLLRY